MTIPRNPISGSTSIGGLGYDPQTQTLAVEFAAGGVHHYAGVPQTVYDEMAAADSKGKYFHQNIRGKYAGTKQTDVEG